MPPFQTKPSRNFTFTNASQNVHFPELSKNTLASFSATAPDASKSNRKIFPHRKQFAARGLSKSPTSRASPGFFIRSFRFPTSSALLLFFFDIFTSIERCSLTTECVAFDDVWSLVRDGFSIESYFLYAFASPFFWSSSFPPSPSLVVFVFSFTFLSFNSPSSRNDDDDGEFVFFSSS